MNVLGIELLAKAKKITITPSKALTLAKKK
jgi:hypothetical protein